MDFLSKIYIVKNSIKSGRIRFCYTWQVYFKISLKKLNFKRHLHFSSSVGFRFCTVLFFTIVCSFIPKSTVLFVLLYLHALYCLNYCLCFYTYINCNVCIGTVCTVLFVPACTVWIQYVNFYCKNTCKSFVCS